MGWKFWVRSPKAPEKRKTGRPKGSKTNKEAVAEREKREYIRQLQVSDPASYDRYRRQQLGLPIKDEENLIDTFKSQLEQIRELAKIVGAVKNPPPPPTGALALAEILAQNPEALKVVLETAVKVAGNGAPAMLNRITGGQGNPAPPTQQVTVEPLRLPTSPAQTEQPAPSNVTQFPAPPAVEYGDKARELIAFLQDKPPHIAAQWLAEQMKSSNDARMLGTMMMNGPDNELSNRLLRLDGLGPIAGLGTWFLDRFDWSRETITELRRLTSSGQSAAS